VAACITELPNPIFSPQQKDNSKIQVILDVTLCRMVSISRRFQASQCLVLQDEAPYGPKDKGSTLQHKVFHFMPFPTPRTRQIGFKPNTCAPLAFDL
jgi:hypothetical protein